MDNGELRLEIDRLRLDDEWADQPRMFHVWALKVAEYQARYDEVKSELELMQAELGRDIRDQPESYGIDKVTVDAVNGMILTQGEYQVVGRKLNHASHDVQVAKAAVSALEHRKRALTMLVELWIRDYYADPRLRNMTDDEKREVRTRGRRRAEDERPSE